MRVSYWRAERSETAIRLRFSHPLNSWEHSHPSYSQCNSHLRLGANNACSRTRSYYKTGRSNVRATLDNNYSITREQPDSEIKPKPVTEAD